MPIRTSALAASSLRWRRQALAKIGQQLLERGLFGGLGLIVRGPILWIRLAGFGDGDGFRNRG